jgi:hypothetical protein
MRARYISLTLLENCTIPSSGDFQSNNIRTMCWIPGLRQAKSAFLENYDNAEAYVAQTGQALGVAEAPTFFYLF